METIFSKLVPPHPCPLPGGERESVRIRNEWIGIGSQQIKQINSQQMKQIKQIKNSEIC